MHPVLKIDLVDVRISAYGEGDGQFIKSVIGTGGGHVEHVINAVYLLLDRCCHIVGHDLGVGARIDRGHPDLRRGDPGILGHRDIQHGNQPGQEDNNRHHRSQARAFNKNPGKHASPPVLFVLGDGFHNLPGLDFLHSLHYDHLSGRQP